MRRDFSAGGVLVRRLRDEWVVAVIRPAGRRADTWVLPKGRIDAGETAPEAALREVAEETGARGRLAGPLGATEYWFADAGERVVKRVAFFLLRYEGGRLGQLRPEFRHEVAEARWLPLEEARTRLTYPGERQIVREAERRLANDESV
jgi:8-oxo-dGTP pyrophosphatase MutT (NUDIX family)